MPKPSRILAFSILVLALAAAAPGSARPPGEVDPAAVVQELLGQNYIVEADRLSGGEWLAPDLHSFLGRMKARGAFPFEKLLVSTDGTVLARSSQQDIRARAEAERFELAVNAGEPSGGTHLSGSGLEDSVRALVRASRARVQDPASALVQSFLLLDILTVRGAMTSAELATVDGGGLTINVRWRQGSNFFGFTEVARWTFEFDSRFDLTRVTKNRETFEDYPRR